jgi:hypothetical protein
MSSAEIRILDGRLRASTMKNFTYAILLIIPFLSVPKIYVVSPARASTGVATVPSERESPIQTQSPLETQNIASNGAYPEGYHFTQAQIDTWLEGTKNPALLRKLIQCESQDQNVSRIDSNGLLSRGILQFNGTSTWADFAPRASVSSTPLNPQAAIAVADYMITEGFADRWGCYTLHHWTT